MDRCDVEVEIWSCSSSCTRWPDLLRHDPPACRWEKSCASRCLTVTMMRSGENCSHPRQAPRHFENPISTSTRTSKASAPSSSLGKPPRLAQAPRPFPIPFHSIPFPPRLVSLPYQNPSYAPKIRSPSPPRRSSPWTTPGAHRATRRPPATTIAMLLLLLLSPAIRPDRLRIRRPRTASPLPHKAKHPQLAGTTLPKGAQIWAAKWAFCRHLGIDQILDKINSSSSSSSAQIPDPQGMPGLLLYSNIVHGPSMTKEEEDQLLRHFDYVLNQVQMSVRAIGQEAIELDTTKIDIPIRTEASASIPISIAIRTEASASIPISIAEGLWKHYDEGRRGFHKSATVDCKADRLLSEKEEQVRQLEDAVKNLSSDVKVLVATAVQNNHCSPEFAKKIKLRIDCMDRNVKVIMKRRGYCFTLDGLVGKFQKPQFVSTFLERMKLYSFAMQQAVTVAESVFENWGTCPGPFNSFGKEAQKLLTEDFSFKKLKLNTAALKTWSIAVGTQGSSKENIKLIMMKLKGQSQSISLSLKSFDAVAVANAANANAANANAADENEVLSTKLSLDKLYGDGLKCTIKLPYPCRNAKIEFVQKKPYYALSGAVGLGSAVAADDGLAYYPNFNLSAVLGFKSAGFGYQLSFDTQQRQFCQSVGINIRTDLSAVGLTLKQGGPYTAFACTKFLDSSTTIAGQASYTAEAGEEQGAKFCVGIKHSIDPEFSVKAIVGSDGVSLALKKTWFAGKYQVKAAAHFEKFKDRKLGVVFSYGS